MKQQTIDFARAEQLDLLSRAQLEAGLPQDSKSRANVRGSTLRLVLRAIDDFGRGGTAWPSQKTLAERTGLSDRQVKRAIAALKAMSVLCVECHPNPYGGRSNHYAIVWSELALLVNTSAPVPNKRRKAHQNTHPNLQDIMARSPKSDRDTVSIDGDMVSSDGDMVSIGGDKVSPKSYLNAINVLTAPKAIGGGGGDFCSEGQKTLEDELLSVGVRCVRRVQEEAKARKLSETDLLGIVSEFRANKAKFRSAGAILERIRSGGWPAELEQPEQVAARANASDAKKRREEIESIRYRIISAGRKAKAPDEAITAKLRAALDHFGFQGEPEWA